MPPSPSTPDYRSTSVTPTPFFGVNGDDLGNRASRAGPPVPVVRHARACSNYDGPMPITSRVCAIVVWVFGPQRIISRVRRFGSVKSREVVVHGESGVDDGYAHRVVGCQSSGELQESPSFGDAGVQCRSPKIHGALHHGQGGGVDSCRQQCLLLSRLVGMSTTIRVSEETRDRLASLATTTGRPMTRVLDDAVEALERKVFFDRFNRRYQELRDDSAAWSEIEQERGVEEGALGDVSE